MEKITEKEIEKICKKYCKSKKFIILLIKICNDNKVKNTIKCVKNCVKQNNKTSKK